MKKLILTIIAAASMAISAQARIGWNLQPVHTSRGGNPLYLLAICAAFHALPTP
jgi:hypothetical protein